LRASVLVLESKFPSLRNVIAAFLKSGSRQHTFENKLAPSAEHLDIALKGFRQAISLQAEMLTGVDNVFDLLFERQHVALFGFVATFDFIFEVIYPFAQRIEDGGEQCF